MTNPSTTTARTPIALRAALAAAGVALALAAGLGRGSAVRAQGSVDFQRDVWPIFEATCVTCHGPEDQFNDLRLDSKDAILRGGKNGKVLVAGDPAKSPLYVRVSLPADDLDIMPAEGDPLTAAQIDAIRRWIAEGANFGSWNGG
jgi:mono/diheme cytochrome c family protein